MHSGQQRLAGAVLQVQLQRTDEPWLTLKRGAAAAAAGDAPRRREDEPSATLRIKGMKPDVTDALALPVPPPFLFL